MFYIKINGKAIRRFTLNGNYFIEGRSGTQYTVNLTNSHYARRLFVISIDGINAVSGKSIDEDPHNGYVINGYGSLDLKGFRINDTDVAAFKFVKSNQSYAKEVTGSKQNNGVIGVKVYDEKVQPIQYIGINNHWSDTNIWKGGTGNPPMYTFGSTSDNLYDNGTINVSDNTSGGLIGSVGSTTNCLYNCSLDSSSSSKSFFRSANVEKSAEQPANFNLGTGWGEKKEQKVIEVSFEVGNLVDTQIVYYASREELEKMGIDFGTTPKIRTMPSAFGEKKYCPTPKGWQG